MGGRSTKIPTLRQRQQLRVFKIMKLLTKELEKKLPSLYSQDDKGDEAIAYVKFFDPCGSWTWYATEYDPKTKEFFGLVDGQYKELGYFSLDQLKSFKGRPPFYMPIERDIHFTPTPISKLM